MSVTSDEKKIVAVRTFAKDVKRAREAAGMPAKPAPNTDDTAKPSANTPETQKPKDPELEQSKQLPDIEPKKEHLVEEIDEPNAISEPIYQNKDGEEVTLSDEPTEVPPFHSIRASSADDTALGGGAYISLDDDNLGESMKNSDASNETALKQEKKNSSQRKIEVPESAVWSETESFHEEKDSIHIRDDVFDTEEVLRGSGEGTIVSDKKQSKFKVFPSIVKSIQSWFEEKQTKYQEDHTPKKSIERSSRRKDVIQAAARQSNQAPRGDYEQVTKRLRDVERVETDNDIQIKDENAAAPSWSHKIDDNAPRETEQRAQGTTTHAHEEFTDEQTESTSASSSEVGMEQTDHAPNQKPIQQKPPVPEPVPTEMKQSQPPRPQNPSTPPTEPPEPRATQEERGFGEYREKYGASYNPQDDYFAQKESLQPAPEEVPPPEERERPRLQKKGVPEYRQQRVGQPRTGAEPSGATFLTLIAVIITAILLGVGTTIWWFTRDVAPPPTTPVNVPDPIIDTQTTVNVPLDGGRDAFLDQLADSSERSVGRIVLFVPTANGTAAEPERIFEVLALSAPGNMLRSVNTLSFGTAQREDPFMVMRFSSFDTVFAGMLEWESIILRELEPFFGSAAPTNSIDSRINNRDVRVLIDENGDDRIVYGFIDKNTLLITTDRDAYMNIIPSIE